MFPCMHHYQPVNKLLKDKKKKKKIQRNHLRASCVRGKKLRW